MIVKFLDKFGKLVKSITSIGYLPVDMEPVKDSKHLLSSGGSLDSLIGLEEVIFANMDIPSSTLRFSFGDKNYDPTLDMTVASKHNTSDRAGGGTPAGYGGTWKKLFTKYANIWDYTYLDDTLLNEFDNGNFSYEATPATRFWSDVEHNPIKIIGSNTAGCESFKRAFQGCHAITEIWSLDMSDSVNNYVCFSYLKNLKKMCAIDLTSSTDCRFMLQFCSNLVEVEGIELPDDDSLTNSAQCMFQGCVSLQRIGGTLNMKSFTNMQSMFSGCTKLNDLNIENTSRVANLQYTFAGCHSLPFDVISSLDTSSVTLFYSTFAGRFGYTNGGYTIFEVDGIMELINSVPSIDMSSATDCRYMFHECDIRTIDDTILSSLTGTVKIANMFMKNVNCESGIYEAYQVLDAIDDGHTNCFKDCGIDTEEGRAALAQIPQSWGGLAEE